MMPEFKAYELKLDEHIADQFGTIFPFPRWLKQLDGDMLSIERKKIMAKSNNVWVTDLSVDLPVRLWGVMGRFPLYVQYQWLKRHNHLMSEIHGD
jgi:hypothetical protein